MIFCHFCAQLKFFQMSIMRILKKLWVIEISKEWKKYIHFFIYGPPHFSNKTKNVSNFPPYITYLFWERERERERERVELVEYYLNHSFLN